MDLYSSFNQILETIVANWPVCCAGKGPVLEVIALMPQPARLPPRVSVVQLLMIEPLIRNYRP